MNYIKNTYLALKDQGPLSRFFRNFIITRNAWGLFHINSHIVSATGNPKIKYNTRKPAEKASLSMTKKYGGKYAVYKCLRCSGYHIGKTRINNKKENL